MSPKQGPLTDWRTVSTADGDMSVFVTAANQDATATLVVLQEAFGVNAHIQSVSSRFAASGYRALAPDLFHRSDDPVVAYDDREEAMRRIATLGVDQIATDVGAAVGMARELDPDARVIVCGFCFGARAAFTAACAVDGVDGAICFYGPGVAAGPHAVLDLVRDDGPPMQLFFGAKDPTIPADQVEAITARLKQAGVRYDSQVYQDAGHAFACDARPEMYHPGPALDAWMRSIAFIDKQVSAQNGAINA